MAAAQCKYLCGDYGLILTNLGSTTSLLAPIKSSKRIKYSCVAISSKYVVFGASTGGLYVFDKNTFRFLKLIGNKEGLVKVLSFSYTSSSIIAVGTSLGKVLIWDIGASSRDKPKCIKRSDEHKGSAITSLCWDECDSRLFVGNTSGIISAIHVSVNLVNKGFSFPHLNEVVHKCDSEIVQLDYAVDRLLISTLKGCTIYNITRSQAQAVGTKPRDGLYGACFFRQEQWNYPAIYSARPGLRLWEVSFDGQVLSTQQYKKLLAIAPTVVLRYETKVPFVQEIAKSSSKFTNFGKLLIIRDRFLVTWDRCILYILDPIVGKVVCWTNLPRDIQEVCCHGNQLYIHFNDGDQAAWFGLLSTKECVAALFNMNCLREAAEICIDCRDDIITGSARDVVPKSVIVKLKENFQSQNGTEDLASTLEILEQELEESYVGLELTIPRFFDLNAVEDSSVMSGDLGPIAVGSVSCQDDDDNLSVSQFDDELKIRNQSIADISLEKMLVSAAVLADKLKNRRVKSPLRRVLSPDCSLQDKTNPYCKTSSGAKNGNIVSGHESLTISEEGLPSLSQCFDTDSGSVTEDREALDHVHQTSLNGTPDILTYLSDDSDTRPLASEDIPAQDESTTPEEIERSERSTTKEKKKKKRKVVTVSIDTPKSRSEEGEALITEKRPSDGTTSTYSSFGQTEVKSWSSQPDSRLSPVPIERMEYPPAIPAMLTKAKDLLLRRKMTADQEVNSVESFNDSPLLAGEKGIQIDSTVLQCPPEVKGFVQFSKKTRDEVKSPSILYYPDKLIQTLREWISHVSSTLSICESLGNSEKDVDLKTFLDKDESEIVTLLIHMCFDIGLCSVSDDGLPLDKLYDKKYLLSTSPKDQGNEESCLNIGFMSEDEPPLHNQREINCYFAKNIGKGNNGISQKKIKQKQSNGAHLETPEERCGGECQCTVKNLKGANNINFWHCKCCLKYLPTETSCMSWRKLKSNKDQQKRNNRLDCERAQFLQRYFTFIDIPKLRRTLTLLKGDKHYVYRTIRQCLADVCANDAVNRYIQEKDIKRALHVLHDGIEIYCDSLIYHLARCYNLDGRATVLTSARLFPHVQPWEVAEMCLDCMASDHYTNAENFVLYVDLLLRWQEEIGTDREKTISSLCKDQFILQTWIHCLLLSDGSGESRHCSCRMPRAGSHHIAWKNSQQMEKMLDFMSQQSESIPEVLRLFWQHGYWTGFMTLCTLAELRLDALLVLCFLGDVKLLGSPQKWGILPKSIEDWKFLVQFFSTKTAQMCSCTPYSGTPGWLPDLNFQSVLEIALDRLGTRHTIQLLEEVPILEGQLTRAFFYKCILAATIERKQSDMTEEVLKKLDSYLWSQRPGVLVPSSSSVIDSQSYPFVRTLEDAATHWGSNIRLADAECLVCSQPLPEQVSSCIQGVIVFECGHVFHKHCLPERACVVCFQRNLRTIASA